MTAIILFGLAAAVYPQLLAVVLVILTLARPRIPLWVCCALSLLSCVAINVGLFLLFRARDTVAGSTDDQVGYFPYLLVGGITLVFAAVIGTEFGRARLATLRGAVGSLAPRREISESSEPGRMRQTVSGIRARGDRALRGGSLIVAAVTGALLAMPGPFDVLAAGRLALGHHTEIEALVAIVVFAALKFLLIEVPSIAYLISPEGTSARVARLQAWLSDNRMLTLAAFVALIGFLLIARGITGLS